MAQTTVYSFFYPTAAGDLYPYTEKEADVAALEAALVALGQIFGAGVLLATDYNATLIGGALSVSMSSGVAVVGDTGARKFVRTAGAITVTGLTPSTTNYIYKTQTNDGTSAEFSSNTTGTPPANTILLVSVVTNGTEGTSKNDNPTGRVNFGAAALTSATQTLTNKTLGAATISGNMTFADAVNVILNATTGTKIGTAITQKIGFFNATPVVQPAAYTPTNVTVDRAYDANATTLDEVADVLGTLIADLKALGLIG